MADARTPRDATHGARVIVIAAALTCVASVGTLAFCAIAGGPPAGGVAGQAAAERPVGARRDDPIAADTGQGRPARPAPDGQRPADDPGQVDELSADIRAASEASGMLTCVCVIDLTSGVTYSCNGDRQLASASMIKMVIAHAFLEQVREGAFSLDSPYTLKASDIVGGTGTPGGLGTGARVTYRDILTRMIDVSDNTGTNILIDAVGMEAINQTAQDLGLTATRLNRHMMDRDAMAEGLENYTSAHDMARLMRMVHDGTFVDEASSKLVLRALEQQQDRGGVRDGLPAGVTFAHKTGTLETVRHDGGIVEGERPFVLVVLCGGEGFSEQGALATMAEVAHVAYAGIAG